MEHTIRKIISIDKEAENYKRSLDEQLNKKKDELKKQLVDYNRQAAAELTLKKEKMMELTMEDTKKLIEKVREDRDKEIRRINECYSKVKEDVIKETLTEFFKVF